MKKILILLLLALSGMASSAQTMEVGVFGGLSYYLGELNPAVHFRKSKPAYGVLARVNINSRWSLKASVLRGKVAGDDLKIDYNTVTGLNFESPVTDVAFVGEFNFFDYFTGSKRDRFTPYIFGGVGMSWFNPTSGGVKLHDAGTEGQNVGFDGREPYKLYAFTIPFGIGFKYSLSSRFSLSGEWGMRRTVTDYIDDISTTYYLVGSQINPNNTDEVLSDPTLSKEPYMERGDPATKDWYNFTGITLTYKFRLFGGRGCPDQQGSAVGKARR
jgi:hypothetical protein